MIRKAFSLVIILFSITTLLLVSCATGGGTGGRTTVYTAGWYIDDSGKDIACYWKDGVRTDLSGGTGSSEARAITVSGGSVYIVGYFNDGDKNIACYWKDGVKTDLSDGTGNSQANGIYVAE